MEMDSNTLLVIFIMEKKFKFYMLFFFALLYTKKMFLHKLEVFPKSVATSNDRLAVVLSNHDH